MKDARVKFNKNFYGIVFYMILNSVHSVYILKCNDGTLYTGSTVDIVKRLREHNGLKCGAKYTRGRRPVEVVYQEECKTFAEVRAREAEIKRMSRSEKLELIKMELCK